LREASGFTILWGMCKRKVLQLCGAGLALLVAGCGSSASSPNATPTVPAAKQPSYQLLVASSQLALGRQRFTFGLMKNNRPVENKSVMARFFWVKGTSAVLQDTVPASFNFFAKGLPNTPSNSAAFAIGGVYVSYPVFNKTGSWGVEADLPEGGRLLPLRAQFAVQPRLTIPQVGQAAPRSNNPTVYQVPATKLDSGRPPDDMHKLSIAGAIAQHKPLVVLFATAAFCESRLCGPEIETVQGVENKFRGRVNFVHIEVYKNAVFADGFAATFLAWHLQTEPWVFVVNRRGIITAEFEGATPASEIVPAIRQTLTG
jgi:hypothetical protein